MGGRPTQPYDRENDFLYHSTLAYKLTDNEFRRAWSYLFEGNYYPNRPAKFFLHTHVLRVTFLNDSRRIISEYDFLQRRLLTRAEPLSRWEWEKTLRMFRIKIGVEGCSESKKSPYLISDLHLDHANIIRYCARPFSFMNVDEMNEVLIENWNNTVRNNPIYFLGDLSFGRDSRPADYWLDKLSGKIYFISGDHDKNLREARDYAIIERSNTQFLLVHDPDHIPINWKGWIIHGHKHNNDIYRYPFINGERKTINVSAEVVNYRPVSLDYLISLNLNSIKRMDLVDSVPQR